LASNIGYTSSSDSTANSCDCCEQIKQSVPLPIKNQPGQSVLGYRVGIYSQFMEAMLSGISSNSNGTLRKLTSRDESNDLAIAILSCSAIIFDILTFYQERIANEGFLRTATERRSILEIARLIGYELRPGVSASTFLAFSLEDNVSAAVDKTIISIGTKVQSLPSNTQMPQIFETTEKIVARPEWNKLKIRLTKKQEVNEYTHTIFFKGVGTRLKEGDAILIVKKTFDSRTHNVTTTDTYLRIVAKVELQVEEQMTKVFVLGAKPLNSGAHGAKSDLVDAGVNSIDPSEVLDMTKIDESQRNALLSKSWNMSEITSMAIKSGLSTKEFLSIWNNWARRQHRDDLFKSTTTTQVYAFRIKAGVFGNNAPSYNSLPPVVTSGIPNWDISPPAINEKETSTYYDEDREGMKGSLIYLDNVYSSILPSSESEDEWVAIKSSGLKESESEFICKIIDVREETVVNFAMSAQATGLVLDINKASDLSEFLFRKTRVYAQSEELELFDVPDEAPINGNNVVLEDAVAYLSVGQPITVTGEIEDKNYQKLGLNRSEIAVISEIGIDESTRTTLTFEHNLEHNYKRDTVILNANVARANHGQTKEVVLGGGDPSQYLQHFVLRETPLTFVAAATASGVKSTLEIRVNDINWKEVPSLYNLDANERAYITRMDNDFQTHIYFGGNATKGIRPSAGLNNITGKYRIGIGREGMLKADQLTVLMDRPLGVRSVTNPVAPTGAADPETIEYARENASLTVVTMDRLVSLTDYEIFTKSFAGIGKAQAIWIWDGLVKVVYITVASETEDLVNPASDLYVNLVKAINNYKDPVTRFRIGDPQIKTFNIDAAIIVSDGYDFEKVKVNVEEVLKTQFSFEAREFGQDVSIAEIFSAIQMVEGVATVDVNNLYLSEQATPALNNLISSEIGHWDDIGRKIIPAELVILNSREGGDGIKISEMQEVAA